MSYHERFDTRKYFGMKGYRPMRSMLLSMAVLVLRGLTLKGLKIASFSMKYISSCCPDGASRAPLLYCTTQSFQKQSNLSVDIKYKFSGYALIEDLFSERA